MSDSEMPRMPVGAEPEAPGERPVNVSSLAVLSAMGAVIAAIVILSTVGAALWQSLQPVYVDASALEEQIEQWMEDQYGTVATVSCPVDGIPYDLYDIFTCEATSGEGDVWKVEVTVGEGGASTWHAV